MRVVKRNGTHEPVSFDKVLRRVQKAAKGLNVQVDTLAQNIISNEREQKELTIYSFPETEGSTEMLDLNVNLNVLLKILNFRIKNKKK